MVITKSYKVTKVIALMPGDVVGGRSYGADSNDRTVVNVRGGNNGKVVVDYTTGKPSYHAATATVRVLEFDHTAAEVAVEQAPTPAVSTEATPAPVTEEKEGSEMTATIEYTKTACFFDALANQGTTLLAEKLGGTVTADAPTKTVTVDGTKAQVKKLETAIPAFWDAAYEAFKAWKRDNKAKRAGARDTAEGRKALFTSEAKFLVNFAKKYDPSATAEDLI